VYFFWKQEYMDKRVKFDFDITFSNGGGIQGQDFRLDMDDDEISDAQLAEYIVRDLRLLMVGEVKILNKEIISEPHKRAVDTDLSCLIDLSHTIENGLVTYKGLPAPIICDYLSREDSRKNYDPPTEFQIGKIEMVSNTGTYIDCPFHRYADGKDLSEVDLVRFADLDGMVIRADFRQGLAVDTSFFQGKALRERAVLVHTGWGDAHWNTPQYYENHPFITADAAEFLKESGVKLVGIDSHNIDDTRTRSRPVHTTLLGAEILIVEHVCNLGALPDSGFTFNAIPPKVKGMGTFPVRAFAKI
jgi:arylformamidase